MVLILCKTALISGTQICSRPINHLSIFQYFNLSIFQSFNKFSLLCNTAITPLWLCFFHILRYHQLPRHCLVEDNPLLVGKLGKSKLGIFMYAHLLFQVNNKYNIYIIFIIIYIILIIRNIPYTHWKKQFAQFAFWPICPYTSTNTMISTFLKKSTKHFVVSKNLCTFALCKT